MKLGALLSQLADTVPYNNPSSGSWRIPGVFTLQEYYQAQNRYETAGTYQPKPGDVAFIHMGSNNGYSPASGHGEVVIKVSGNQMTTVAVMKMAGCILMHK